jgi:FdhD protein
MDTAFPVHYYRYEFEKWKGIDSETIVEAPVTLTVNGEVWMTFMCTPVHLEALAVGFLFNEGVIEGIAEVSDVRVCEHGDNVDVWLTHEAAKPKKWTRTSGCTGGVTSVDFMDEIRPGQASQEQVRGGDFTLRPEQIGAMVDQLFESQEIYKETGGVHTSGLGTGEKILISAEDIGRHNTLDKIAGLFMSSGGDLLSTSTAPRLLISTGRISSEMLQKASRMGVPVLISRTSPSSLSIQMAERRGITLIGYARRNRFQVYSHAARIIGAPSEPDTGQRISSGAPGLHEH